MNISYDQVKDVPMKDVYLGTVATKLNQGTAESYYKNMSVFDPGFERLAVFSSELQQCFKKCNPKYAEQLEILAKKIFCKVVANGYALKTCIVVKMSDGSFKPVEMDVKSEDVLLLIPLETFVDPERCHFAPNPEGEAVIITPYANKIYEEYGKYSDTFFNLDIIKVRDKFDFSDGKEPLMNAKLNTIVMLNYAAKINDKQAKAYLKDLLVCKFDISRFLLVQIFVQKELMKIFSGFGARSKVQKLTDSCMRIVFKNMFYESVVKIKIVDDSYRNDAGVRLTEIAAMNNFAINIVNGDCKIIKMFFDLDYVQFLSSRRVKEIEIRNI